MAPNLSFPPSYDPSGSLYSWPVHQEIIALFPLWGSGGNGLCAWALCTACVITHMCERVSDWVCDSSLPAP